MQQERVGRNEALFREINNRLAQLNDELDAFAPYGNWMCECQDTDCHQAIEMTPSEYRAVREHSDRFVIAPHGAHFYVEAERVVEETARYWVIEKKGRTTTVLLARAWLPQSPNFDAGSLRGAPQCSLPRSSTAAWSGWLRA